jgi:dCMP deaminase
VGYNGFPKGCRDDGDLYANRDEKYARIVHAEVNAVLYAHEALHQCTIYTWPSITCDRCAGFVINAGITRVVGPGVMSDFVERWDDPFKRACRMYAEAGVTVDTI